MGMVAGQWSSEQVRNNDAKIMFSYSAVFCVDSRRLSNFCVMKPQVASHRKGNDPPGMDSYFVTLKIGIKLNCPIRNPFCVIRYNPQCLMSTFSVKIEYKLIFICDQNCRYRRYSWIYLFLIFSLIGRPKWEKKWNRQVIYTKLSLTRIWHRKSVRQPPNQLKVKCIAWARISIIARA